MRHVSHVLTYPLTIASVLHQSSPYQLGKDLTVEGLKSLAGREQRDRDVHGRNIRRALSKNQG